MQNAKERKQNHCIAEKIMSANHENEGWRMTENIRNQNGFTVYTQFKPCQYLGHVHKICCYLLWVHLLHFSGLNLLLLRVYMIGSVTELIGIVNHINALMTSDLTLKPFKMRNDTVTIGIQLQIMKIVSRIIQTGIFCEDAFLVPLNTFPCDVTCFVLT